MDRSEVEVDPAGFPARVAAGWLLAALVAEASDPDTWRVHDCLGRSLLVTCDRDGRRHALRNACTHRGTRLTRAPGRGRLRCPYHGWTFACDGRLLGASRRAGLAPCRDEDLALAPASLEAVGALLFAAVRPAASLREALGSAVHAALERLAPAELALAAVARPTEVGRSWRAAVGEALVSAGPGRLLPGGHSLDADGAGSFVFPNLHLRRDGEALRVRDWLPVGPGRALLTERRLRGPAAPPLAGAEQEASGADRRAHFEAECRSLSHEAGA